MHLRSVASGLIFTKQTKSTGWVPQVPVVLVVAPVMVVLVVGAYIEVFFYSFLMYMLATTFRLASFLSSPLTCQRYFSTLYLSLSLDWGTVPYIFFDKGSGSRPWAKVPIKSKSSWPGTLSVAM